MPQRLYIETVGCQMNVLDSELVGAALRKQGYELVPCPDEADVILLNTCSVRRHAEDKVYSHLGQLKGLKKQHPDKIIGVLGCMAQNHQRSVLDRAPHVDLVVGPGQLHRVPELIQRAARGAGPQVHVSLGRKDGSRQQVIQSHNRFDSLQGSEEMGLAPGPCLKETEKDGVSRVPVPISSQPLRDAQLRPTPFQAYVRIQIGCDKFCTYCVVPSVRGPEQCRPPDEILAEARHLADHGCLEITLLGQTVNSYRYRDGGKTTRLTDLLVALHEIEGLERLKFVTNYPKDMTDDLLQAVRDLPKVSPYLHVPAQSGADRILQRMKRGYTVQEYRDMMSRIRQTIPDAAVSSDFIVGFCGETDQEFERTAELVRECRFKNSFIFKYSERPGTKGAALLEDDVPYRVKRRRNNDLLAVQDAISEEDNRKLIGHTVTVLVEGPSTRERKAGTARTVEGPQPTASAHRATAKAASGGKNVADGGGDGPILQLTGRTHADRIVVFDGHPRQVGQLLPITVDHATAHTLFGREP